MAFLIVRNTQRLNRIKKTSLHTLREDKTEFGPEKEHVSHQKKNCTNLSSTISGKYVWNIFSSNGEKLHFSSIPVNFNLIRGSDAISKETTFSWHVGARTGMNISGR